MPAIVLVPGLNCSARLFSSQIPALWQFGPVTVADHRHGETITAIAQHILATAPPRFALAGLSMGGYIALEMVRLAPERVEKLALLATNARADSAEQQEKRRVRIARAEAGQFEADVMEQFEMAVHRLHGADASLRALNRTMALEVGAETFVAHSRAIIGRRDQRQLLPAIAVPTLVVAGDGDQIMPAAMTDELAAAIPGARLVTLQQSGHLLSLEQPEQLNAALTRWLAE